jgi:hypothetical protein
VVYKILGWFTVFTKTQDEDEIVKRKKEIEKGRECAEKEDDGPRKFEL